MNIWERKATIIYKGHRWEDKAVAAGRAMDNALKKEYTKGGTTNCKFLTVQWLKFFDWNVLVREGLEKQEILSHYPECVHDSIINDPNGWYNRKK